VASYRSDDLHRRHPLRRQVAEWARLRAVSRMQLGPLSDDSVRTLVAELVPGGLSETELADVVARAEGNPFFVEELTSAAGSPGRWVPSDLADVLLVRLDRLDPPARQVVRAASAAGRRVAYDLLAAVAELDPVALEDGLRGAVEMNVLLAERGRYEFRHALLGEAVYDDLLPGERVALHRRYVAALQEGVAGGTAAELARHARLALDLDTALLASVEAGAEASRVGGPVEAAQHYEQALELLTDPRRSAQVDVDVSRIAVRAAEALQASGDPERAVKVLRQQLADLPPGAPPAARARMLSTLAHLLTITESTDDPVTASSDALALVPDGDSGLRAVVLATHARVLADSGQVDAAEPVAVEALGLAERLDRPQLVAHVVTTISGLRKNGSAEGLRAALRRAVEQAAASGELGSELRARYQLGRSFQDGGELEAAEEWFRSGMACGVAAGTPYAPYALEARWQLGQLLTATGRWDDALDVLAPQGLVPPIPRAMLAPLRLTIEMSRGADVAAEARGLRMFWAREGAVAIHAAGVEIEAAGHRADAAAAAEAYAAVVDVLSSIWRPYFSAQVRLAAQAAGALARIAPVLPAAERAAYSSLVDGLHRDGLEVVGRHGAAGDWGVEGRAWTSRLEAEVLRFRWAAGVDVPEVGDLVAAWRAAEGAFTELGHVHEVARVRAGLAGILRASGDLAAARELGDLAREVAHRLGATRLLDELRDLGSTPLGRGDAGSVALTPREQEILALVAEGRSNGEIARQLYISTKTVSVHVSNILGKLGAAGRTEAAAIARRRGLLA
jgi:DNA-binding CsgD family transcriptional regulator